MQESNKQSTVNRFRGVEVISFALRATKPQFDPRRKHFSVRGYHVRSTHQIMKIRSRVQSFCSIALIILILK